MSLYEKSIYFAIKHLQAARDNLTFHYAEEFDVDWAVEQFEKAIALIERMKDYPSLVESSDCTICGHTNCVADGVCKICGVKYAE